MYKQEKQYVVLAKDGEKLAKAGLQKITQTGEKIRIEYFLSELPLHYGIRMECILKYRQQGEVVSTKNWKETLTKTNSHYMFSFQPQKPVEEIMDCRLVLQGNEMIVPDEKLSVREVTAAEQTEKNIRYIRDIDFLKEGNETMQELYYNSFLLHGFYQYRYFILGKDFIGVPDHFYEREAIAAKMMGFPYFMEADFVNQCSLDGEIRNEMPKIGSFGYYLKKLP